MRSARVVQFSPKAKVERSKIELPLNRSWSFEALPVSTNELNKCNQLVSLSLIGLFSLTYIYIVALYHERKYEIKNERFMIGAATSIDSVNFGPLIALFRKGPHH